MRTDKNIANIELSLKNHEAIETTYEFEDTLMAAIRNGDVEEVRRLLNDNGIIDGTSNLCSHIEHRLPYDRLRYQKNNSIILNTLIRTAARSGGLPIIYLHIISDRFAVMAESATSPDYLEYTLQPSMCIEYSIAVERFSTKCYSNLIKEVIKYITSNLTVDINISDLAEQFHVSPSTISRKFKEETKMNINDYINHQRIEMAKYHFEEGYESITEVSYKTGYNDSSYFTKVFKKFAGVLPKEYIRNVREER